MNYRLESIGLALVAVTLAAPLSAALPEVPQTRVSFQATTSTPGGLTSDTSGDGPVDLAIEKFAPVNYEFGKIEAHGIADFGTLKIGGALTGRGLNTYNLSASALDVYTIENPAVANGTAGTVTLYYDWGGSATVLDVNDEAVSNLAQSGSNFVLGTLSITQNQFNPGSILALHSDFATLAPATTGVLSGPHPQHVLSSTIHFTYGQAFPLRVGLTLGLSNGYTNRHNVDHFDAIKSQSFDETAEYVEGDFFNTATLTAFVINEGDSVAALSTFDLSPVLTTVHPAPVPLPAPVYLLIAALPAFFRAKKHDATLLGANY